MGISITNVHFSNVKALREFFLGHPRVQNSFSNSLDIRSRI